MCFYYPHLLHPNPCSWASRPVRLGSKNMPSFPASYSCFSFFFLILSLCARIFLEDFPGGYAPVALCFLYTAGALGGSPICVHRMGSCYDLAGLTQPQVNSSSMPLTRVHSSQSFPSPKAEPVEAAHSNISCRYIKLYCLLPSPSAPPLHGCVHGLGNAGTPGLPITLPWPWVLEICLMELRGKKQKTIGGPPVASRRRLLGRGLRVTCR